jgi:hypothetical protein
MMLKRKNVIKLQLSYSFSRFEFFLSITVETNTTDLNDSRVTTDLKMFKTTCSNLWLKIWNNN